MPLIAIEGADAVGKSTQVDLLADFLLAEAVRLGVQLRQVHLPRLEGGRFSSLLRSFLAGDFGQSGEVDARLVALLFACDRFDVRSELQSWLLAGDIVLMDRYVASNVAYQCAKVSDLLVREQLREWIEGLEYEAFGLPRASVTLYFEAPLAFSLSQIAARRAGQSGSREWDVHESDVKLQIGVREVYSGMAAREENFFTIRCGESFAGGGYIMRRVEEIFTEVTGLLAATLTS